MDLFRFLLFFLVLFSITISYASAEEQCEIKIRLIKASGEVVGDTSGKVLVGEHLKDIEKQLGTLSFSKYQVVDQSSAKVSLGKSANFALKNGEVETYSVSVAPHDISMKKVNATVDWRSADNKGVLSTKFRVLNGQNIVFGADGDTEHSTILCLSVSCS
ncbi:hypothetical protein BVY02_02315 [bacterium J17]|nr:hypothetical protein BVY02_02315 [bacterium J17]